MELRTYWKIIWKRIWLVALIVGIVALYVGYQYYHLTKTPGALKAYSSNVVLQAGVQPNGQDLTYAESVGISDTIAETFITSPILQSKEFDTQVVNQIQTDMTAIIQKYGANPDLGDIKNAGAIGGSISSSRAHTIITLSVTWNTSAGAWAIANALGEVSSAHICSYINYTSSTTPSCSTTSSTGSAVVYAKVLSSATDAATVPGSAASKPTSFLILLLLALIIGIALTFLIDYLDDRVRDKEDAAQFLQLPVLGDVPTPPRVSKNSSPKDGSSTVV